VCAILASTSFVALFFFRRRLFFRLSTVVALLLHVFFQWPIFALSEAIEKSLDNKYGIFLSIQIGVFSLIIFSALSDRWLGREPDKEKEIKRAHIISLTIIAVILAYLFLRTIPFYCTALYSILFDPESTLLAREISIKFNESRLGLISYGALLNSIIPALFFLCVASLLKKKSFAYALPILFLIFLLVMTLLLGGAKGNLLPTIIMCSVALAIYFEKFSKKTLSILAAIFLAYSSLALFEVIRDRVSAKADFYRYGECTMVLGGYEKNRELIDSLFHRKQSLGLSDERILALDKELDFIYGKYSERGRTEDHKEISKPTKLDHVDCHTSSSVTRAILYRAFVIPMQVAVWHFIYAEEEDPGLNALSFTRHWRKSFINAPEQVYQKYATIYSCGDRTSTSTAPTSFLLAYPAYLNWIGLLVAIFLVILTDTITAVFLRKISGIGFSVCVGLLYVMSFNFIVSSFESALVSHGGLATLALIFFWGIVEKLIPQKNHCDQK